MNGARVGVYPDHLDHWVNLLFNQDEPTPATEYHCYDDLRATGSLHVDANSLIQM
jgi:hypothetical protein